MENSCIYYNDTIAINGSIFYHTAHQSVPLSNPIGRTIPVLTALLINALAIKTSVNHFKSARPRINFADALEELSTPVSLPLCLMLIVETNKTWWLLIILIADLIFYEGFMNFYSYFVLFFFWVFLLSLLSFWILSDGACQYNGVWKCL